MSFRKLKRLHEKYYHFSSVWERILRISKTSPHIGAKPSKELTKKNKLHKTDFALLHSSLLVGRVNAKKFYATQA